MMEGRRYSEGLHQALEAKEGVTVQNENQTLASITFQNYFRLYPKLAGMTGTAMTEAQEFGDIYKLDVIEIPTNVAGAPRGYRRRGLSHRRARKTTRSSQQVLECRERQQPVLVGTVCIEKSEALSALFKKQQGAAQRAERPLSRAGGATSSPRPAGRAPSPSPPTWPGRGTDIQLGGNLDMRLRTRARGDRRIRPSASGEQTVIRAEIEAAHEAVVQAGGSSSSAASGMRAGASTTSCAAAPAARAIPAPRNSSSRSKTI